MIVAEKYKHRPHPLEVVEVTLANYLEVAVYIGAENSQLHRKTSGEGGWVSFEFKGNRQLNVSLNLPGKITINHEGVSHALNPEEEKFLKDNYKKA